VRVDETKKKKNRMSRRPGRRERDEGRLKTEGERQASRGSKSSRKYESEQEKWGCLPTGLFLGGCSERQNRGNPTGGVFRWEEVENRCR